LPTVGKENKYVAKIYGFRIYGKKGSKYEGMLSDNKNQNEEKENEKEN
jgi:hypothetical protein